METTSSTDHTKHENTDYNEGEYNYEDEYYEEEEYFEEDEYENGGVENEDYDSSDSELQVRALPVSGVPDMSGEAPGSAEEYLRRVRWEAKQLPQVVSARPEDLPPPLPPPAASASSSSKPLPHRSALLTSHQEDLGCTPGGRLAAPGWVSEAVRDFHRLREDWQRGDQAEARPAPPCLPRHITDSKAWRSFCLGEQKDEEEEGAPAGRAPLDSVMRALDPVGVGRLLAMHVEWWCTSPSRLSYRQGVWLFSLLCCLSEPLDSDTCACLRSLLKQAYKRRIQDDCDSSQELAQLNIIMMVAGRFFGQGGDMQI